MTDKLIFISCGQQTAAEIQLGTSVKRVVDSTAGFKAYFAEYVQSLDALATNVYEGIRRCSGLISFLHERGMVAGQDGETWGCRSSVWVNQEIAILAYRKLIEAEDIPILVFKDAEIRLEGAMTALIVNPLPIESESAIIERVKDWLMTSSFPSSSANDDRFQSKWDKLSPTSRKVLSALLDEGGANVKEVAIRVCLREEYGFEKNDASKVVTEARSEFINTDLVKWIHNLDSGDEMTVNPTWAWHIQRALKNRKD